MKVRLKHDANPDIKGGYWSEMARPQEKLVIIDSFSQASLACRDYIVKYELGSGNWVGGEIYDDNGNPIATVSYNGRVWDMDGKEIGE